MKMRTFDSLKSIFRKEAEERKAEATPAPGAEPPVHAEVKIDTKIKRKELQIGDMLEGRYEIRDIKKGGMEGLKCY